MEPVLDKHLKLIAKDKQALLQELANARVELEFARYIFTHWDLVVRKITHQLEQERKGKPHRRTGPP